MQQSHLINNSAPTGGQPNINSISQSYGVGPSLSNGGINMQNMNAPQALLIQQNGSHSQKYNNGAANMINHK